MTQKQIDEIKARCEAATPAPWSYFYKHKYNEHHVSVPAYEDSNFKMALFPDGCPSGESDSQFIAHAREDIPLLVEACEQLQTENAELRERLDKTVELPCKVGDTLFYICDYKIWISSCKVLNLIIGRDNKNSRVEASSSYRKFVLFKFVDFGKTVFLTCEEAEKALMERESDD